MSAAPANIMTEEQQPLAREIPGYSEEPSDDKRFARKETLCRIVFNIGVGQLIAIGMVSGGVFTKNLQDYGLNTPLLQLSIMYTPLAFYLIYHFTQKGRYTPIAIWKLFLCSLVDTHATVLIVYAYTQTTLTSVMIIEDFSIPSAVLLSFFFLRVRYDKLHYAAIALCLVGISCGFLNDFLIADVQSGDSERPSRPLLGDFCALSGAFLYALENVLQELFIRKKEDVFNFLGFIGGFGLLVTLVEATILGEWAEFEKVKDGDQLGIALNYGGMAVVNFFTYTIIPFYVARSGATLLNLSNVTTIIWSMLFDILLFGSKFYPLCMLGFTIELAAIVIFSIKEPKKSQQETAVEITEKSPLFPQRQEASTEML